MTLLRALGVAVAALLVAGCSDTPAPRAAPEETASAPSASRDVRSQDAPDDEPTGPSGSGAPSSTLTVAAPPPPAPPGEACYRIPFSDLAKPTHQRAPVDCAERHDAQTFHVGTLDLVVDGHALAVDADRVVERVEESCDRRLATYLGGTAEDRRLTRLHAVWFAPTLEQAARGARWYRCDVVALAGDDRLFPLPPPRQLRGVLDRPAGASYGLCGTTAPGDPDFSRVICARPHAWRAVSTIALPRGRAYPGVAAVRSAGDDRCRDLVRDLVDDPLSFRFGWEWPTREQWGAGRRHGYCWAPD